MTRALELAHGARFHTAPNPAVGCVIAREGNVVAEAATAPVGGLHAEARALGVAGDAARGGTAYVTLEPCNHHGRTPPCADALIAVGVERVVIAVADPHPEAGGGVATLQAAGIAVDVGCCESEARWHHRGFLSRHERGRPWVRLKLAASLDGRTAMASGESQWITGGVARVDVQRLRAEADCVLTGVGTLTADDPSLNVRVGAEALGAECERQPLRAVVDTALRSSESARWLSLPGDKVVYTAADQGALGAAEVCRIDTGAGGVSLAAVWADLAARDVGFVHLECGPTLAGQALQGGWVDELVVYIAPALLGDAARPLAVLPGLARLGDAPRFAIRELCQLGDDLRVVLIPSNE